MKLNTDETVSDRELLIQILMNQSVIMNAMHEQEMDYVLSERKDGRSIPSNKAEKIKQLENAMEKTEAVLHSEGKNIERNDNMDVWK